MRLRIKSAVTVTGNTPCVTHVHMLGHCGLDPQSHKGSRHPSDPCFHRGRLLLVQGQALWRGYMAFFIGKTADQVRSDGDGERPVLMRSHCGLEPLGHCGLDPQSHNIPNAYQSYTHNHHYHLTTP